MSRTKNTIFNTGIGIFSQIVLFILSFFVRTNFVSVLGIENLGLKTLLIGITSFLNLSELGISSTVMYSLYEYIKDKNFPAIKSILNLSSKIFKSIGLFILFVGFLISFFIVDIVNAENISSSIILSVYLIQVLITTLNYFFLHKKIFLSSNQLNYIIVIIDTFFHVLISIVNIYLLIIFKDFLLYSLIYASYYIISNLFINIYFNIKFKNIKDFKVINFENFNDLLKKNIPYSLIIKLGGFVYFFMDSFIINYFLGLTIIGILSNYQLILNSVKSLIGSFNSALGPSLGNFLSEVKDKENTIILFKRINFLFFFLGSIISIGFALLINPFINLWLGSSYLLAIDVVLLLSSAFFFDQISTSLWHFMNASGKFKNESISSLLASILKLFISISLVPLVGISGIFISTIISNLIYFINRYKFLNNEFFKFYKYKYLSQLCRDLFFFFLQFFTFSLLISLFEFNSWFSLFLGALFLTIALILSNFIIYRNNDTFNFYYSFFKKILLFNFNK